MNKIWKLLGDCLRFGNTAQPPVAEVPQVDAKSTWEASLAANKEKYLDRYCNSYIVPVEPHRFDYESHRDRLEAHDMKAAFCFRQTLINSRRGGIPKYWLELQLFRRTAADKEFSVCYNLLLASKEMLDPIVYHDRGMYRWDQRVKDAYGVLFKQGRQYLMPYVPQNRELKDHSEFRHWHTLATLKQLHLNGQDCCAITIPAAVVPEGRLVSQFAESLVVGAHLAICDRAVLKNYPTS